MEQNAFPVAHLGNFGDRHYSSDLVVCVHNCNESGVLSDSVLNLLCGDIALIADRKIGYLKALFRKIFAGVEHSVMLESGGDDVLLPLCEKLVRNALDSPVISLGAAACEIYLRGLTAENCRYSCSCVLNGSSRISAEPVNA